MPLSQDVKTKPEKPLRQFFINPDTAINELPCTLTISDPDTVNHAKNVLRLKPGDALRAVDPLEKKAYRAVISAIEKRTVFVDLQETLDLPPDAIPPVILGCGVLKEQRWDALLQKTTELGVRGITPLVTERTVVHIEDPEKKHLRWQQIVKNAAEQSEGLFIPNIHMPVDVSGFCQTATHAELQLLLDERPNPERKPLREILEAHPSPSSVVAVVGPEGGWTPEERQCFLDHGFQSVALGERVLRSETAAIALMGILRHEYDAC